MTDSILFPSAVIPPHLADFSSNPTYAPFALPQDPFLDAFHLSPQAIAVGGADNRTIVLVNPA